MKRALLTSNENERLEELVSYDILNSEPDSHFDDIIEIAKELCGTERAFITIVGQDHVWVKSPMSARNNGIPREHTFCSYTILQNDVLEIPDTSLDPRAQDNPYVQGAPNVKFYAGAPLVTQNGHKLGALCVIGSKTQELSEHQKEILRKLARQVMILIERQFKEKKLREANDRLDVIVNNIPLMLSTFDDKGNVEWANTQWTKELGWDLDNMKGKDLLCEFYPDPVKREEVLTFMINPENKWMDSYLRKRDGSYIYTSWHNIRLADGKTIGIGKNIHERKLMENTLKNTNQRLDFILEGAGLGSWDWNLLDNSVIFDRRWCEMIGLNFLNTPMQLSTWKTRVHPDDLDRVHFDINQYLEGKSPVYENIHRMKHTNGRWVWILDRGKISEYDENGRPVRFTGIHFDITKQKAVEQELRDNQEKNHAIYDGSNDAIMMLSEDRFFDCNRKTLELFSVSSKDEFNRFHPSDISPPFQPDGEKSETKSQQMIQIAFERGHHNFEWTHKRLNGEEFPCEILLSAFEYRGKRVLQATVRDITERKKLEAKYDQQRKLAQHHAKLASIGQMAAGVGHEINNPLTIIKGYISTIQEELSTNESQHGRILKMMDKLNIASDRIVNIVKGLRTFSRSDTDQLAKFSLREAIEESYHLIKDIYEKEGISLHMRIDDNSNYQLYGNRGRIQQVIVNLLSNAKDATEGPLTRIIEISLSQIGNFARFSVSDNGKGIPEDMREKVFDPFFTTKGVNKGTGIGLSVVSSVIKEHGGEIWIDSNSDGGAVFHVELPLTSDQRQTMKTENKTTSSVLTQFQLKVMIVDDEGDIRDFLKFMLSRMGIEVTVAENGTMALEKSKASEFDLVITDLKMPLMDGLTLIQEIHNANIKMLPKFILMTGGLDYPEQISKKMKHSVASILQKPFDPDALTQELQKLFPDRSK